MGNQVMCKRQKIGDLLRAVLSLRRAALVAIFLLAVVVPMQTGSAFSPGDETYVFVRAWDNAPLPGTFKEPRGVAVDSSGNVYVTDTGNYRIQKFTADGVFITEWGKEGWGQGMFGEPTAIAMDSAGNVYVGDLWNSYEFQKFSSTGEFLASWYLLYGYDPMGIAVDSSNNVYVATRVGYGLVLKYDVSGNLITSWKCTSESSGASDGIAVDVHGYVYVADTRNGMIYKFDLDGHFLTSWLHSFGWNRPSQLAVDGVGNVYALGNSSVVKYNTNGALLGQWGTFGSGDGQFHSPQGVAVGPDGSVYVVDTGNNRIQKFTVGGTFVRKWGTASDRSRLRRPEGVTVSGDGTVFVADTRADQVQSFTSQGVFLVAWGTMDYPGGVSADATGYVYVSGPGVPDSGTRTIYGSPYGIRKYTSTGTEVAKWGTCCSSEDGRTNWASGIAMGPDGNIYVADTTNDRIQKFAPDGTFLTKWGSDGSGDGQFDWPEGVAVAPDGSVYVADTHNDRIQKFTADGVFLDKWGGYGSGDGKLNHPKGIAVDSSGNVYVADAFNDRVQKFTPDGVLVTKWGSYGQGNGQFDTPLGVAVDANGYVYVADARNNRIQKFERASPNLSSSAKLVDKKVAEPSDILNYTIILSNNGSLDATEVLMTDTLPASTTYNAGSLWASSGGYDELGGVITWEGTVSVGVPVTITFSVSIDAMVPKGTLIINTVTINDGVNPPLDRTVTTIADPYQVYLPLTLKGWHP